MKENIKELIEWIDINIDHEKRRIELSKLFVNNKEICSICEGSVSVHLDIDKELFIELLKELDVKCEISYMEKYYHYKFIRNGIDVIALFNYEIYLYSNY